MSKKQLQKQMTSFLYMGNIWHFYMYFAYDSVIPSIKSDEASKTDDLE